ncbi:methylated-DNA--[protein]-cysteine S-methyltransferase [Pseudonocardia ailaonensis]|uniref:Methylated-DNA--[protein]-cysteine S-methyltransferase n=1 Tax=Pseudonocardia ailaonensis TaxID=367279 RepID=A0ABN2NK77_9PSEU
MELSWKVVPAPGPIGALTVGVSEAGLCLVAFGEQPQRAADAATRLGADLVEDERTEPIARELAEYFAGTRQEFTVPLDWRLTASTQRTVLQALHAGVGYGETTTYAGLAATSGAYEGHGYTAARGVGSIMGSNPIPVVVPCHRVLAADGLGGFGGGRATKEYLLSLEGALLMLL